nr:MAG TPA: hypothetical protein [Caudoviricetes sp.]
MLGVSPMVVGGGTQYFFYLPHHLIGRIHNG